MIRPAAAVEFPRLLAIQLACISELGKGYTSAEIQAWISYLKQEGANRYKAYENDVFTNQRDEVVAFVSWSQERRKRTAAIECLYTLRENRGQGTGRLLLREAELHLISNTIIHVRSTLNARRFYEYNGYSYMGDAASRAGLAISLLEKKI